MILKNLGKNHLSLLSDCSLVVLAHNEEQNLDNFLKDVDESFSKKGLSYEVIIVDENSTDNTYYRARELRNFYPVHLYEKKEKLDKYNLIFKGIYNTYAKNIAVLTDCNVSADRIIEEIKKFKPEYELLIGKNQNSSFSYLRQVLEPKNDLDNKLYFFRKEKADDTVVSNGVNYFSDPEKMKLELGTTAVDKNYIKRDKSHKSSTRTSRFRKFQNKLLKKLPLTQDEKSSYKEREYDHYSQLAFEESAYKPLTLRQKLIIAFFAISLLFVFITNPLLSLIIIFSIFISIYFFALILNFLIIARGYRNLEPLNNKNNKPTVTDLRNSWPSYTILCPLYKEWEVLPQFVKAISKLDYPQERLQILLLLEENDIETLQQVEKTNLPDNFEKVIVPNSYPKTKPKACNYGLKFAIGKFTVIYDAEDVPEPDQLKKVVRAFQTYPDDVICLQAKLNFYNSEQNLLTRLFTAEYSLWFDLILVGLHSLNLPIPLGGTSNHFKTQKLKELKGWDAFNVTEDCDLGIRLYKKGFRTAIIDTVTWEEANSSLSNWIKQRSRWVKGYIQTYLVHLRNQDSLFKDKLGGASFHLVIGGTVFALLINPLMWATSTSYFLFRPILGPFIESLFPPTTFYIGILAMVIGNFMYFFSNMIGLLHRKQYHLVKYVYLIPFYFLMMSLSAWVALYQFLTRPHYWFKTKHGLHLKKDQLGVSEKVKYAY